MSNWRNELCPVPGCSNKVANRVQQLCWAHYMRVRRLGHVKADRPVGRNLPIHGHATRAVTSSEYSTWVALKARCLNPNDKRFKDYGGRGITFCERWQKFENFFSDMGSRPPGLTLERINNDLGYCKDNCKWGTRQEQANNNRGNRLLTFNGRTQSVATWARESNILPRTLYSRLANGWPLGEALTLKSVPGLHLKHRQQ